MKRILNACVTVFTLALFLMLLFSCSSQPKSYKIIFYIDNQEFLVKELSQNQVLDLPTPPEYQNKSFDFWGYKINGVFYEIEPINLNTYANNNNIIELFAVYTTDQDISSDRPSIKIEVKLINTLDETYISLNYNKGYLFNPPKLDDTEEYEFDGWYYDFNYSIPYEEKELKEDTVLYSKFSVKITHIFSEWKIITEPSCSIEGKKERKCQDCSRTEEVTIPKLKHLFNKTTESATCEKGGCERYTCGLCGFEYLDNLTKPIGHNYGEFITEKEPSCLENGEKTAYCQNCNSAKTQSIDKINHNYSIETFKPDCLNQGYELHTCIFCEDSFIGNETDALGHSLSAFTEVLAPSCLIDGYAQAKCFDCSYFEEKILVATGHFMSDYIVTSMPQCILEGLSISECKKCDFKEEKRLEPTGHNYQTKITLPTCEKQGFTEQKCTNCEDVKTEDFQKPLGHLYDGGEVNILPTCSTEGELIRICKRENCLKVKAESIDKLNHKYFETVLKPTCAEIGYSVFCCEECGDNFTAKETPMTEHNYTAEIIAPSCTSEGYTHFVCNNCESEYSSDYIDMTQHEYESTEISPTCDKIGYTQHICKLCSAEYKDDFKDASHEFLIKIIAPTCLTEGYTLNQCSLCQYSIHTEQKPPLGHNTFIVKTESTCILQGRVTEYCHNCDYNAILEKLPFSEHVMGEWIELDDKFISQCDNCEYFEEKIKEKAEPTYYYDFLNDVYHVTGATDKNITEIEIPSVYKGKKVSEIKANAFKDYSRLSYVRLNENLLKIRDNAFANCLNLRAVILPSTIDNRSLDSVSVNAFANCPKITLISYNVSTASFPEPRWFSESFRFYLNSDYMGNIYQNINKNNYFYENGFHYLIKDNNATVIKYSGTAEKIVFKDYIEFNNKKIYVTEAGEYSFINNETVKSVTLNENLKTIKVSAFNSCANLLEVFIGAKVTVIYKFAFKFCPNLKIYLSQSEIPTGFNNNWKDSTTEVLLNSIY